MPGPSRDKAQRERERASARLSASLERRVARVDKQLQRHARAAKARQAAAAEAGADYDSAADVAEARRIASNLGRILESHAALAAGTLGAQAARGVLEELRDNGAPHRVGWSRRNRAEAEAEARARGRAAARAAEQAAGESMAAAMEHPTPLKAERLAVHRGVTGQLDREAQRIGVGRATAEVAEGNGVRYFIHTGPIDGNNHPDSLIYLGAVMTADEWDLVDTGWRHGGIHPNERGSWEPIEPDFTRVSDRPALERAIETGGVYRNSDYFGADALRQAERPLRPAAARRPRRSTVRARERRPALQERAAAARARLAGPAAQIRAEATVARAREIAQRRRGGAR